MRGGYSLGSPNHQRGWSLSSTQRSFLASYGSQNAFGSATWIDTGIPSWPRRCHMGSSFGSSIAISLPVPL